MRFTKVEKHRVRRAIVEVNGIGMGIKPEQVWCVLDNRTCRCVLKEFKKSGGTDDWVNPMVFAAILRTGAKWTCDIIRGGEPPFHEHVVHFICGERKTFKTHTYCRFSTLFSDMVNNPLQKKRV